MTTIERIHMEAAEAIEKIKRGESLNANDKQVLRIWTNLTGKKAGNAGKRIDQMAPKKQRIPKYNP